MPRLPRAPGAAARPGRVSNSVVDTRPDDLDEGLAELAAPLVRNQTTAIRFRAAFVFAVALCLIAGLPLSAQAMPGNHRATLETNNKVTAADRLAKSESHSPPCSQVAAYAMFYTFLPLADLNNRGLAPPPVNEWFARCQYRLFFDGQHFTFSEDDWILGGRVDIYDYVASGITRAEAIAALELDRDRVWLAKVEPNGSLGPAVEQPLIRTAYTDWNHSIFGLTVWQHRAFIRRLPPGDYVSTYRSTAPGEDDFVATVYLHILPRQ